MQRTRTRKRPTVQQTNIDFKLPHISDEVLLVIFNLLRKIDILSNKESSLLSINSWPFATTHTCHRWRIIALENKTLWTDLEYFTSQSLVQAFLDRSSPLKLSVSLNISSNEFYLSNYTTKNGSTPLNKYFGFALQECRARIENLFVRDVLEIKATWSPVVDLLKVSPPTLQDLSLGTPARMFPSRATQGGTVILPSLTRAFSALKHLSLSHVCVKWEYADLNNLSTLCLKSFSSDFQPSITQIIVILKHCPLLQELELHDIQPANAQPSGYSPESDVINLPELHKMQLIGIQYTVCKQLLKRLVFNQTINWHILCVDYPAHLRSLPEVPGDALMQFTDSCDEIQLTLMEEHLQLEGYSLKSGSLLKTSGLVLTDFEDLTELDDVLHVLRLVMTEKSVWNVTNNVTVRLDLLDEDSYDKFDAEAWIMLFKAIPNTSCLKIRSPEDGNPDSFTEPDLAIALQTLVEDETPDKAPHYPLPLLKNLIFEHVNFTEDGNLYELLLESMETRCNANVRLEKLNIENCYGASEEQIEALSEYIDDIKWRV